MNRVNILHYTYLDIALSAFHDFENFVPIKKILNLDKVGSLEYIENEDSRLQSYIKVIVFSAMALESYSYEILCRVYSDQLTENHLEKLSVEARFLLIEKAFINFNGIDSNRDWYQLIRKLIKTRNFFVHAKSKLFPENDNNLKAHEFIEKYGLLENKKHIRAKDAIHVLYLTEDEMYKQLSKKDGYFFSLLAGKHDSLFFDEEDKYRMGLRERLF